MTLGLIHGSQPDALVLCHEARREAIHEVGGHFPIPSLDVVADQYLSAARLTNPDCVIAGISVNTSTLDTTERGAYLEAIQKQHGIPVEDPMATGMNSIADALIRIRA